MKKILTLFALSLAFFGMAQAQIVHHVTLKNHSELNGYIKQYNDGLLTFRSENANIVIDEGFLVETKDNDAVDIARLDSSWIKWAEQHNALDASHKLVLSTITFKPKQESDSAKAKRDGAVFASQLRQKGSIAQVHVIEKGEVVRYVEQTPNEYVFTWNDISKIHIDQRPATLLTGINCTYSFRSDLPVTGQPAGETENTLSLYTSNGIIQTFDIDNVIKYTFFGINPNQELFEQSELLDIVNKRSGTPVEGIIVEQDYSSSDDAKNYVVVQQATGDRQKIYISDISTRQRKPNPGYHPLTDILLSKGEIVVNRQHFQFVDIQENHDIMTLDSICRSNIIKAPNGQKTTITVEYNVDSCNVVPFQLVTVTKTTVKKKNAYSFSYKDLITSVVPPTVKVTTSVNNTTKVTYAVTHPGIYALYDAKRQRAIPIVVKGE